MIDMVRKKTDDLDSAMNRDELNARLATAKEFVRDLLPKNKLRLDDVVVRLQQLGFQTKNDIDSHGAVHWLSVSDPETKERTKFNISESVRTSGELNPNSYGEIKTFLNGVVAAWEARKTSLEKEDEQMLAVSMRELRERIASALDLELNNVEIVKNDEGTFVARFTHGDAPYLRWDVEIPAAVAGDGLMFNQAAFNDFMPAMQPQFDTGLAHANNVLNVLGHWQEEYDIRTTYDADKNKLTIHQDEFHLHPAIEIGNISLSDLPNAIDDAMEKILEAAHEKTDVLKNALKEKCGSLGLNCTFENDIAHISGPTDGAQFTCDVGVSYNDKTSLASLINGDLAAAYQTFSKEQELKVLEEEKSAPPEKPGFKLTQFPEIQAQRGQREIFLTSRVDMENVRDAMLKLQSINFDPKDERAIDYAFSNDADYGVVKLLLTQALKAIGLTQAQLREEIEGLGVASPLLSQKDGISRPNAKEALKKALLTADPKNLNDKTSLVRGFSRMVSFHPDEVRSLLHIIDYIASKKAEEKGVEKLDVALDQSMIPKGAELRPLKKFGGRSYLAPEKISSNGNGHAPKHPITVNPPRFNVPPLVNSNDIPQNGSITFPDHADHNGSGTANTVLPVAAVAASLAGIELKNGAASQPHTPLEVIDTNVSEHKESESAMPQEREKRKYTTRVTVAHEQNGHHEQNGQAEPSHERFGRLVRTHRLERKLQEGEFAEAIHEEAINSKKPLEEEVNEEAVRRWEDYEGLPKESTLLLIVKVLIDDNEKIPGADKAEKTNELIAAYESAALAFGRLLVNHGQLGDMSKVRNFISKVTALREQVGLTDDADFAQAINDASGPNITEDLEEVKQWPFVAEIEDGRRPSPGLKDVMGDALHKHTAFKPGEREALDESYETTFAAKVGKHAAQVGSPAEEAIKANFIAAKAKLRSFFGDDSGTSICKRAYPERERSSQYFNNMATNFFGSTEIRCVSWKEVPGAIEAFKKLIKDDQLKAFDAACVDYIECFKQMDGVQKAHSHR